MDLEKRMKRLERKRIKGREVVEWGGGDWKKTGRGRREDGLNIGKMWGI